MADITIIKEMPVDIQLPPIKPGADWDWTLEIKEQGLVVNTTGYTFVVTGKDRINGEVIFNLSIGSGITHTAALGKFAVHIAGSVTALYDVRSIVWDCLLTTASGAIIPPLQGIDNPVTVLPKV